MAGKKFNYYQYQMQKSATPWLRGNSSKVAVNPERITTLLEVAIEHYGKKCARCGSKKSLTVHHRHYRTVGFEKPEADIVLLCQECHNDLHERSRQKRLNRNDVPYVDPKWEDWLSKLPPPEERPQGRLAGVDPSLIREWKAVFRDTEGQEWVTLNSYVTYEDAVYDFSACLEIWDLVEIVSIEDCTDKLVDNGFFSSIPLEPHQRDLLERPEAHRPRASEASPPPQLTDPGKTGDGDA